MVKIHVSAGVRIGVQLETAQLNAKPVGNLKAQARKKAHTVVQPGIAVEIHPLHTGRQIPLTFGRIANGENR